MKKTNEKEIVETLIENRGMVKSRLAERADITAGNLAQILRGAEKGLNVATLTALVKAMDYEVVIVPKWTARELKKDKENFIVEERR